jgi:hypothetical protein
MAELGLLLVHPQRAAAQASPGHLATAVIMLRCRVERVDVKWCQAGRLADWLWSRLGCST